MARPLLPLLCGTVALLLPWAVAETARCSRPKEVPNARIDVGNNTLLNTSLRYTCNPGYKRKAGTSSLIQCTLHSGSTKPDWTPTSLQCIRDPALPPQSPSPDLLLTTLRAEGTTPKETTEASLTSSPSPAAPSTLPGPDGPSQVAPTPREMHPPLQTSILGEGTVLGTTSLPTAPADHAAVSLKTLASSIGVPALAVAAVVACCCWRMKIRRTEQVYEVAEVSIPMMAPATHSNEVLPPNVFATG